MLYLSLYIMQLTCQGWVEGQNDDPQYYRFGQGHLHFFTLKTVLHVWYNKNGGFRDQGVLMNKMNRFAKLAWVTLAWNVLDVLWGVFVRATGSGAGCGNHWPTCNGAVLPTPENIESVIEYTHRILSGVALILVLVLLLWGWRKYPRGHSIRKGVVGSAVFILLEAALGAGLVLLNSIMGNDSG